MNILLLIGLVALPSTIGDQVACYQNAEAITGAVVTEKMLCPSQCMKTHTILPDGTEVVFRTCGEFQWKVLSPSIFDPLHLTPDQRKHLLEWAPDTLYYCKGDFCNGADSIVPTSSLLSFIVAATAIIVIMSLQ